MSYYRQKNFKTMKYISRNKSSCDCLLQCLVVDSLKDLQLSVYSQQQPEILQPKNVISVFLYIFLESLNFCLQ